MINSRKIEDLDPRALFVCREHLRLCHDRGIELIVTSTYRDLESQAALYAIGRTVEKERRAVTNARPGHSWHNFRAAYDLVPLVGGKCVWDEKDPLWKEVVALGKQAGAEAGADWPLFKDLPHFQVIPIQNGTPVTLTQAAVLFKNTGSIFA